MASRHRLFVDQPLNPHSGIVLDADASHYLTRVLRLRLGAQVELFNGDGYNYASTLKDADKSAAVLLITERSARPAANPKLHLAIGLLKGDKLDYALQKATELDVATVYLLTTERSELKLSAKRLANRLGHWKRIMRSACEQSGRTNIPQLHPPTGIAAALDQTSAMHRYYLEPTAAPGELQVRTTDVCLFTGPEGGFSPKELQLLARDCTGVRLGELVLRAETAPLVALTLAGAARRAKDFAERC